MVDGAEPAVSSASNERERPGEPTARPELVLTRTRGRAGRDADYDLLCLSHLRWDWFTWQRPQHLMSRFARQHRVFYVEEPIVGEGPARLAVREAADNVWVVVPVLPAGLDGAETVAVQRELLDRLLAERTLGGLLVERTIHRYVLWYYNSLALPFSRHLRPLATIYDCMDEWSAFDFAPPEVGAREAELFTRADLVFAGGPSLYEAKRRRHPRVYLFPSSVDVGHFAQARRALSDPADQAAIPRPRLGFCGTIDERMDRELLGQLAAARPDWQFVMMGPIIKINQADLPRRPNIWFLGGKPYQELPPYLAGWDVALLPFALNKATRFISPTKTPEYLAAGKPVVSTPIADVVRPYGEQGLVRIAETVDEFVAACAAALEEDPIRLQRVDAFLGQISWDRTWADMAHLIDEVIDERSDGGQLRISG